METQKNIPRYANSQIKFMLYNYKNINKLIENRKKDLIDINMGFTTECWLKGLNQETNTQENLILSFDEDPNINILNSWKSIFNNFIKQLQNCKNKIYFLVFKYKYILNENDKEISEKLNISIKRLKEIDFILKNYLYQSAIKNQIFERRI